MGLRQSMADLERYELPDPDEGDGRDWLRHEFSSWPDVSKRLSAFLDALHWRQRAVVVSTYGEQMTQDQVAYKLGVSIPTVQRDVADVAVLVERRGIGGN